MDEDLQRFNVIDNYKKNYLIPLVSQLENNMERMIRDFEKENKCFIRIELSQTYNRENPKIFHLEHSQPGDWAYQEGLKYLRDTQ